jgi:tRNA pseudouridine-54 N-methylase
VPKPGALEDDLTTVLARPGAQIDDVVGSPDRLFVVFDHYDRVAEVSQALQRRKQA